MKKKGNILIRDILVFLGICIFSVMSFNIPANAAEEFPSRPIEFVVCWGPGGGADRATRILAPYLEKAFGVSMKITNKSGGSGMVGVSYALNKKPDGYTLFGLHQFGTYLADVLGELPYDLKDIYPICNWIDNINMWAVLKESPFKTYEDLAKHAKQNPGKLKIGISSSRGSQGVGAAYFQYQAGLEIVPVPFGGSGKALTGFLGGHVDLASLPYPMFKKHIEAGKVRPLLILGNSRIEELPNVRIAADLGYEPEPFGFAGAGVLANTPKDRIKKISDAFDKVMNDPKALAALKKAGFMPFYMDHNEFMKHIQGGHKQVMKIKDRLK
jgi:tripartite-type tricarboxylate transporter receptor subunit TctC